VFRFILQLLSETFLILRRTERDIITHVHRSSCKVPVILVGHQWNLSFLNTFSKNTQISNLMKNCPVGAEFHAGRRTDVTELIVAFRKFANAPKTDRRRSAPQTSLLSVYVLDTRILWYESDLVRSQRAERCYCTDVALNVKLCVGDSNVAPLIRNFRSKWKWVVSFTPRPIYPRGRTPVPVK
jgi:hypothetical protein